MCQLQVLVLRGAEQCAGTPGVQINVIPQTPTLARVLPSCLHGDRSPLSGAGTPDCFTPYPLQHRLLLDLTSGHSTLKSGVSPHITAPCKKKSSKRQQYKMGKRDVKRINVVFFMLPCLVSSGGQSKLCWSRTFWVIGPSQWAEKCLWELLFF